MMNMQDLPRERILPGLKLISNLAKCYCYPAMGLLYLHEKADPHIIHCDIKSDNVLMFDDDVAKIGDFDLSKRGPDMAVHPQSGVFWLSGYHAPEYASSGQFNTKSDVYSFGVVLLELLTGCKPLDRTLPRQEQSLVHWATPKLSEDKVSQCVDPKLGTDYPPKVVEKGDKVQGVMWNNNIDLLEDILSPFSTYIVGDAQLEPIRREYQYASPGQSFQWVLSRGTYIRQVTAEDQKIPYPAITPAPFSQLRSYINTGSPIG